MILGIPCPHCQASRVDHCVEFWFIHGFVFFSRYGTRIAIGCASCVRWKVLGSLVVSAVLGWWCFPWGIGTPAVIVQNIAAFFESPDQPAARRLLSSAGISIDAVRVGPDGFTSEERRFRAAVLSVLRNAIWADGYIDEREIRIASEIASAMLGDESPEAFARSLRQRSSDPHGDLAAVAGMELDSRTRLLLLRAAIEITAADGRAAEGEMAYLNTLAACFAVPHHVLADLLDVLSGLPGAAEHGIRDKRLAWACRILGLAPDTTLTAAKRAYHRLCLECHPDHSARDEESVTRATERMFELNEAYDIFLASTTLHK